MKFKKTIFVAGMLMSLMFLAAGKIITFDISGLESEKLEEREKTAETILKNQKEVIKQLIDFAAKKVEPLRSESLKAVEYPWRDNKHLSILLLGDLRASEAVPVLVENIEYENTKIIDVWGHLDKSERYPAVEALIKIGMPSVEPVIEKMARYDKECVARYNCVFIIERILGTHLAKEKLKIVIEQTKDPAVRKNLEAVLPLLKTEKEKFQEELEKRKAAKKVTDPNDPNKPETKL